QKEEDLAVTTCPLEQQIEEFDLTNFMLEEEFNQEQDCLQNWRKEKLLQIQKKRSTFPAVGEE
ncbi:hypothetical protein KI387_024067, partial [Taxus chinensis]